MRGWPCVWTGRVPAHACARGGGRGGEKPARSVADTVKKTARGGDTGARVRDVCRVLGECLYVMCVVCVRREPAMDLRAADEVRMSAKPR